MLVNRYKGRGSEQLSTRAIDKAASAPQAPVRSLAVLDIVIPVFNEGQNIIAVLESLRVCVKTPFRIYICYDRSEDTTLTALETYSGRAAMEIAAVKNKSSGVLGAIKSGFDAGSSDAVVVFPR